jgi:hypothetical protein
MIHGLLGALVFLASPALLVARQTPNTHDADDEQLFRSTLPIDGKVVLEFFHKLTLTDADRQRIAALIKKLDADSFKERDQATNQLIAEGPRALPLLHEALPGATLERTKRLERCIKAMTRTDWPEVIAASSRLLVRYRPPGATATLLAYLPFAPEEGSDEVLGALGALAAKDGMVDPVVITSLASGNPKLRGAAAIIAGWHGSDDQRQAVFGLLDDPDLLVRFRAAQGLLAGRQKVAVPIMVSFLKKAPAELAEAADGILSEVAGPSAPKIEWKDDKEHRLQCHAAWLTWWNQHKDKLDLDKIDLGIVVTLGSEERLAKNIGLRFWKALCEANVNVMRKSVAVPFQLGSREKFETLEALENTVLKELAREAEFLKLFKFSRVIKAKEYAKVAAQWGKEYLDNLEGGRFYAVCFAASFMGQSGEIAWIVRVRGGKARVIAGVESASFNNK